MLVNAAALVTACCAETPGPAVPEQRVGLGTSRHRGAALIRTFDEGHVLAIARAVCLHRSQRRIDGPLSPGMDTHALDVADGAESLPEMDPEIVLAAAVVEQCVVHVEQEHHVVRACHDRARSSLGLCQPPSAATSAPACFGPQLCCR